jgi:hypothetical protein
MKTLKLGVFVASFLALIVFGFGVVNAQATPTITVTAPAGAAGGQTIAAGSTYTVTWTSSGVSNVTLYLCNVSGYCQMLNGPSGNVPASQDSFSWYVDPNNLQFPGNNFRIEVSDLTSGVSAYSGYFSVSGGVVSTIPTITVTAPAGAAGGQTIAAGSTYTVTWTSRAVNNVNVSLCTYSGQCNLLDGASGNVPASQGSFNWYVDPNNLLFPGSNFRIEVNDTASNASAYSGYFSVTGGASTQVAPLTASPTSLAFTATQGGVQQTLPIVLTGYSATVGSSMMRTYPSSWQGGDWLGFSQPVGASSQTINVMATPGNLPAGNYSGSIVITSNGSTVTIPVTLTINAPANQPSIAILAPNGGEVWQQGQTYQVAWQPTNFNSEVAINLIDYTPGSRYGMQYGITNGLNVRTVAGQTSFSWTIPTTIPAGNYYKVAIGEGSVNTFSSNYFTISAAPQSQPVPTIPSITVTSPAGAAGGQDIAPGTNYTVTWTSANVSNVNLSICNYSGNCTTVSNVPSGGVPAANGSFNWYVDPNNLIFPCSNCRIKVTDVASGVYGYSGWFAVGVIGQTSTPTTPVTTTPPVTTPTTVSGNSSSLQALQQELVQLMTLLLQLLEKASAQGLLTPAQLNSALNSISH